MNKFLVFAALTLGVFNIASSQISFENKASDLGIDFSSGNTSDGNGVAFFDFDGDGWDDITFTSGSDRDLKFFKNNNGLFSEVTLNVSSLIYQTKQVNWVDFDNDGDKDLFVTSDTNGNRLFRNTGDLNFEDITGNSGLITTNIYSYGASWGDYNNDGFLDVFISNRDPSTSTTTPNYLYRNNGDATFTDVSEAAGIDRLKHLSFCSAFFDFNNDGWQDIYIANDKFNQENLLYKNNGDGTFTEIGASSGTNIAIDAMTVTIGDYNNDGWQDIYVTNSPGGNVLFRNNGDETFTDVADTSGTIFNSIGWGATFLDADNDMDLDLYVSGSNVTLPDLISAAFYENLNNGQFQIPTDAGFANDIGYSFSNSAGDINNDGFPDFVVTNSNDQNIFLWENKSASTNNWLKINLEGMTSNKDGIGSVIEVSIDNQTQYRYTHCGEGYLSQKSSSEFFGVGSNTIIDSIKITWLSGTIDTFNNVSVNQAMTIVEGSSNVLSDTDFEIDNISLYPNPTGNVLNITSRTIINAISVYNAEGQLITTKNSEKLKENINTSDYSSGLYYATVSTNNGNVTKKFIKQ